MAEKQLPVSGEDLSATQKPEDGGDAKPEIDGAAPVGNEETHPSASEDDSGDTPESSAPEQSEPLPLTEGKPSPLRRALSLAGSVLFYLSIPVLIILVAIMVSSRLHGGTPSLFGVSILTVETGSMRPNIPQGSFVAIRRIPAEEIQIGDVITFSLTGNSNVSHRVAAIRRGEDGGYAYITKGDANDINDPNEVPYEDVRGVVVFSLPLLGYLLALLRPPGYGFLIVVIPAAAVIAFDVRTLILLTKKPSTETDDSKQTTEDK